MNENSTKVPVLFLVFNRPEQTKQVFEKIREYRPKQLFIAADGARNSQELPRCNAVKEVVSGIDWDCEVKHLYREKNLGCKTAVKSAIDWFFSEVEMGIILEDDCLPNENFFEFCRINLEKFKDDTRIGLIGGNNFQTGSRSDYSVFFSKYASIWGWATWRRAWSKYIVDPSTTADQNIAYAVSKTYRGDEFEQRMDNYRRAYTGIIDTWDYQWHLTCVVNGMYTVLPKTNLISNIGFDEFATHTKNGVTLASSNMDLTSIIYPEFLYLNPAYEDFFKVNFGLWGRSKRKIKSHIKRWLKIDKR